jgi:hypothetical protein
MVISISEIKRIFHMNYENTGKENVAVDFYFQQYAFCKEVFFNAQKTSTYLSILHCVLEQDKLSTREATNEIQTSFLYFQTLLLKHSIQRPPLSILIFTHADLTLILDHVLHRYCALLLHCYPYIYIRSL